MINTKNIALFRCHKLKPRNIFAQQQNQKTKKTNCACVAFIVSVRGLYERRQLGVVEVGLLTEWVWKIRKTQQKHAQTVGPLTCPLGKRWRCYGKWTRRRAAGRSATHITRSAERQTEKEDRDGGHDPDAGNSARAANTKNIAHIRRHKPMPRNTFALQKKQKQK